MRNICTNGYDFYKHFGLKLFLSAFLLAMLNNRINGISGLILIIHNEVGLRGSENITDFRNRADTMSDIL